MLMVSLLWVRWSVPIPTAFEPYWELSDAPINAPLGSTPARCHSVGIS